MDSDDDEEDSDEDDDEYVFFMQNAFSHCACQNTTYIMLFTRHNICTYLYRDKSVIGLFQ